MHDSGGGFSGGGHHGDGSFGGGHHVSGHHSAGHHGAESFGGGHQSHHHGGHHPVSDQDVPGYAGYDGWGPRRHRTGGTVFGAAPLAFRLRFAVFIVMFIGAATVIGIVAAHVL